MIYKIGMLCKHFKGSNLLEKNIYRIERLGVDGKDIEGANVTYTGDGELSTAKNLVVYSNMFQENKMFAREYEEISSSLSDEKKELYNQEIKVQPLTKQEVQIVNDVKFIEEKREYVLKKFQK